MRRRIMKLAALALSLLALIAHEWASGQKGVSPNKAQLVFPHLPIPAGPFGIGRIGYDWFDSSRVDSYASDAHAPRELMVYLWYPTKEKIPSVRGLYLPGAREMDANPEIQRFQRTEFEAAWSAIVSHQVFSHAVEHASPARSPKRFPVIVLSHGLGGSGLEYTSLIEDLVSHGYAVAAVEHTGVAGVVYFPDGRLVPAHHDGPQPWLSPDERFKRMVAEATAMMVEGAADVRFVLGQLTRLNNGERQQSPLAGRLDFNRVVAMGHSAGAAFAVRACQLDPRFKACIDLDGAMVPVAALPDFNDGAILRQPLLFLEGDYPETRMFGTHEQHQEFFRKKEAQFAACAAGSYDVTLRAPGFFHGSFSDDPLLAASDTGATETALHNLRLVEDFVRAFLDKTLNGAPEPLLDEPGVRSPESDVRQIGH